ncbi:hypothetical protein BEC83_23475 [Escherichia coli]|nr:hypothetical protein [Escherichia coli]
MISLETSASFLGVKNTGASTHRDNKLQLTASGLSELLPDFILAHTLSSTVIPLRRFSASRVVNSWPGKRLAWFSSER